MEVDIIETLEIGLALLRRIVDLKETRILFVEKAAEERLKGNRILRQNMYFGSEFATDKVVAAITEEMDKQIAELQKEFNEL